MGDFDHSYVVTSHSSQPHPERVLVHADSECTENGMVCHAVKCATHCKCKRGEGYGKTRGGLKIPVPKKIAVLCSRPQGGVGPE
jgi:hypothetical protein